MPVSLRQLPNLISLVRILLIPPITLGFLGAIPIWLMVAAIARDLIIVLGAITYRLYCGPLRIRPSVISKLNTVGQLLFVAGVIAARRFAVSPAWLITASLRGAP